MLQISNTILRNRSISGQEAAFRLCHLPLRQSSRSTVFIPTFKKENRIRMLKRETLMQDVPEFCNNIIDRYMARPLYLDSICLFEFAAHWIPTRKEDLSVDDDDLYEFPNWEMEQHSGKRVVLELLNRMGRIQNRSKPAVIKHPSFNPISDSESYHYALVLLYLPFRKEDFCDDKSAVQAFQQNNNNFRKHSDDPIIKIQLAIEIDRALLRLTEFGQEGGNTEDDIQGNNEVDELPFSMDYAERQDGLEAISNHDVFPRPENDKTAVTKRIADLYKTLTPEQKTVFDKVQSLLTNRDEDGKLILDGGYRLYTSAEGGAGKTYLLQLICTYVRNYLSEESLICCAPTGKAAFLLPYGTTLHSAFSLPIELDRIGGYHKLGARKLAQLRQTYKNLSFICIDEISMVNYETFRMIHLRLCEIFETDELLGGKHVFLFGDLLQLPPPRGHLIYRKPEYYGVEVDLWRTFQFQELTVNMRQGDDPILPICRRLRVGEYTLADHEVLETRVFNSRNPVDFAQKIVDFDGALRIFPTNKECDQYNTQMTEQLKLTSNIFTINACDTYADGAHFGQNCPMNILPLKDNKTGGIIAKIDLGLNSRVMLRRNLNTRRGLTNGALGKIKSFRWTVDPNRQITTGDLPRSVEVEFDHMKERQVIECSTVDFTGKRQHRISRRMLPFILAYAVSIHKLQGQSVNKAVISLGAKLFTCGQAYVALSRVTKLSGLAITELSLQKLITTNKFCPANMKAFDEIMRLKGHVIVPRK